MAFDVLATHKEINLVRNNLLENLATIEPTTTASTAYVKDAYLVFNGYLYRTAEAITAGDTLDPGEGGNIVRVDVTSQFAASYSSADDVSYDNSDSGLAADNVQDAVDELNSNKANVSHTHTGTTYTPANIPNNTNLSTNGSVRNVLDFYLNAAGPQTFVSLANENDIYNYLTTEHQNQTIVFSNWTDNVHFPTLYGSGIILPCLDGRNRVCLYVGNGGNIPKTYTGLFYNDNGWWFKWEYAGIRKTSAYITTDNQSACAISATGIPPSKVINVTSLDWQYGVFIQGDNIRVVKAYGNADTTVKTAGVVGLWVSVTYTDQEGFS